MVPRRQPHSDDNQSIDSGDDIGFPTVNDVDINDVDINDVDTGYERGISTGSAISFSRRGEIIEATSEDHSAMRNLAISAGYIKRAGSDSADASAIERPGAGRSSLSSLNRAHLCARKLIRSRYFAHIMVVVVLFDAFLTASDIDARAAGEDTSVVVIAASSACLALYTLELILQVVVRGPSGRFSSTLFSFKQVPKCSRLDTLSPSGLLAFEIGGRQREFILQFQISILFWAKG